MQLNLYRHTLQLKHPFTISRRSFSHQDNLIVELSDGQRSGYGEATFNPYYPNTEIGQLQEKLESLRPIIEAHALESPTLFWERMRPLLSDFPFAHCALDVAAQDLHARRKGMPLYQSWGLSLTNMPLSCYTLGIADIPTLLARIKATPWPIYKIKLGTSDDLAILRALRAHTDAVFRVDANCAWGVEETIEKSKVMKSLGVEFIEQPLAADDWAGMKAVYQHSVLPIIADESCRSEADVFRCSDCFHGINIKLMKCAGLTPALRMIRQAKEVGLKVMVGCMTESTVGISAIAHLLPLLDYVDMDGALFLEEDIASGVRVLAEGVVFREGDGTGVCDVLRI